LAQWSRDFANTPHPEAAAVISKFYRQQAREILAERVRVWSQRTGLIVTALSFRGQKTRWGSLSGKARMSLNWKLIAAPLEIIDYVVIHELCHIQHHNHSADFWQLVETFDPKFSEHKTWLRKNQLSFAFLK
jgi:predicted metal-dependent hydrolase